MDSMDMSLAISEAQVVAMDETCTATAVALTSAGLPAPVPHGQPYITTAGHEKAVAAFLIKTYEMVCDATISNLVDWSPEGNSFLVFDFKALQVECLPKYFKHNNFQSFVRQLNMYGFHKIGSPNHWEFYHDYFLRGQTQLLRFIKRRKPTAADPEVKAAKNLKDEITGLKRERDTLQDDLDDLRLSQTQLEAKLSDVLTENQRLMAELAGSRTAHTAMSTTVDSIMQTIGMMFPHVSVASLMPVPADCETGERPAKRARRNERGEPLTVVIAPTAPAPAASPTTPALAVQTPSVLLSGKFGQYAATPNATKMSELSMGLSSAVPTGDLGVDGDFNIEDLIALSTARPAPSSAYEKSPVPTVGDIDAFLANMFPQ